MRQQHQQQQQPIYVSEFTTDDGLPSVLLTWHLISFHSPSRESFRSQIASLFRQTSLPQAQAQAQTHSSAAAD